MRPEGIVLIRILVGLARQNKKLKKEVEMTPKSTISTKNVSLNGLWTTRGIPQSKDIFEIFIFVNFGPHIECVGPHWQNDCQKKAMTKSVFSSPDTGHQDQKRGGSLQMGLLHTICENVEPVFKR